MFARIRSSLTYANVMATIAVFLALGGGAYAAINLPAKSVGSKQIKRNAVTSSKVKNRSLLAGDFKAGQLPAGATGRQGVQGTKGDNGLDGTNGARGNNGAANVTFRSAIGTATAANVSCNPGDRATGGGGVEVGNGSLIASQPTTTNGVPTGWSANSQATMGNVSVYVVCASP